MSAITHWENGFLAGSVAPEIPPHVRQHLFAVMDYSNNQVCQWLDQLRAAQGFTSASESLALSVHSTIPLATTGPGDFYPESSSIVCGPQTNTPTLAFGGSVPAAQPTRRRSRQSSAPSIPPPGRHPKAAIPAMPRIVDRKREKKFQCTYCQTDCLKFGDWKRHESERHNPKYFWTCPSVGCNARFAIDWRFAQHHKTKHNCVECKCAYQPSVRRRVEPAVEFWGCGFCLAEESLFDNWDARCGHVGRHFEHEGKTRQDWNNSLAVLNLLRRPDVRPFWIGKLHSVGYLEGMEFSPQLFRWAERHVDPLRQTLERTIDGNNVPRLVEKAFSWLCQIEQQEFGFP